MNTNMDKLRQLIAENKMDRVLQLLKDDIQAYPQLQNQLLTIAARFNEIRKKDIMGLLDDSESLKLQAQVNFSVLELLHEMEQSISMDTSIKDVEQKTPEADKRENVFISYNHHDMVIANKLKSKLTAANINVIIDSDSMQAGEDIQEFIEKCVRETGTTLSLISRNSLLSAWVAMESINTFYHKKTDDKKKFIGCFITDDFFKRNFTDEALDHVEEEIKEIQKLVTSRMEKNRSIRDLQNELTRLTELRNNMDEIVRRLRESLCIDIREENLETNFQKIVQAIQAG